jgi:hypothetical protein
VGGAASLQAAMFTDHFAASVAKTLTLALGPVKAFGCPQMHRQMTKFTGMPNYNKHAFIRRI